MPCAICGHAKAEEAHAKPRETFEAGQDDRTLNIIPLCANHHEEFDDARIGIKPDKAGFLLYEGDSIIFVASRVNINNLEDEYVLEKNHLCRMSIRLRLGLIPGATYLKIDP